MIGWTQVRIRLRVAIRACLGICLLCLAASVVAADEMEDLLNMSLEDLMEIEVVSVSRRAEHIQDVASSVYVITAEDIRRSGALRLQDVLKLVPGFWFSEFNYVHVSNCIRSDVSIFNQSVLMLLDGVVINSNLTGGEPSKFYGFPLSEIDRIEVIKGPGGTMYGAGANTGVISIFTRPAVDHPGLRAGYTFGTRKLHGPMLSYGRALSDRVGVSVFGSLQTTDGYETSPYFAGDLVAVARPGFADTLIVNRYDNDMVGDRHALQAGATLEIEFHEDLHSTTKVMYSRMSDHTWVAPLSAPTPRLFEERSVFFQFSHRLDQRIGERQSLTYKFGWRKEDLVHSAGGGYNPRTLLVDLDCQDNLRLGRNELTIGANLRQVLFDIDGITAANDLLYARSDTREQLFAFMIQNRLPLTERLALTAGVKAEVWSLVSNTPEYSPSLRLQYKPREELSLWGAASRSVTTPGYGQVRAEQRLAEIPYIDEAAADALGLPYGEYGTDHLFLPGTDRLYVSTTTTDNVKPIEYHTLELGFRTRIADRVNLDVSTHYTACRDLIGVDIDYESKAPIRSKCYDTVTLLPLYYTNIADAAYWGGEAVVTTRPADDLHVEFSYSLLRADREGLPIPGAPDKRFNLDQLRRDEAPRHVIRCRPYLDLPSRGLELSLSLIWSSEFHRGAAYDYVKQAYDQHTGVIVDAPAAQFDLSFHVAKRLWNDRVSLACWGRNVLAEKHVDYASEFVYTGHPQVVHGLFGGGISFDF